MKTSNKRITLATIKSFIRKNSGNLYIDIRSKFSGMTDSVEQQKDGMQKAEPTDWQVENTLGVNGAWFVGCSRDYFRAYEADGYTGYTVSNACGSFVLAIKTQP